MTYLKKCIDCGKKIDSESKRCVRCENKSRKEANHPNWKGGSNSCYLHRIAKEHFKEYRCSRCGNTDDVHIHHKDRNRRNNKIENIELLCRSCHSKEHTFSVHFHGKPPGNKGHDSRNEFICPECMNVFKAYVVKTYTPKHRFCSRGCRTGFYNRIQKHHLGYRKIREVGI